MRIDNAWAAINYIYLSDEIKQEFLQAVAGSVQ